MVKQILFSVALLCSAGCYEALAAEVQYGNRDFYGFFLGNETYTNANGSQYGFTRQTFASPGTNELIYEFTDNMGMYAATAIDGVFYGVPYIYSSSITMPEPKPFFSYNIYTGHYEEIGDWNPEKSQFKPQDMTYDLANDRLLAVGFDPEYRSCVYDVDRNTGKFTRIVKLPVTAGTIACDAHGRVFVISGEGKLYQVDMENDNRAELLMQLPYSDLVSNQSMSFDLTCNKLYWGANCMVNPNNDRSASTWLVEITLPVIGPQQNYTPESGKYEYTQIAEIGSHGRFLGLYIPYCAGGFSAPGFATDIECKSAENGLDCTLSFTTPVKCFNGEDDTTVDGYDIYRDGVRIYTAKGVSAGQRISFTDTDIPASGTYRYDIVCYSFTGGDGPKTPVYAYVGFDRPAAVSGFSVESSDDFSSVTLSWQAPTEGAYGGTYIPENTRYDITRPPDNVVVATDITETSVVDKNIRRLLNYTYRVTSKNDYGASSAISPVVVAGPAIDDLPLEETFENPTALANRWTVSDHNADTFSWLFGSDLGHSVFGDYEMTAEYIISPTFDISSIKDADDWIISPPIAFEEGKKYCVTYEIRSLTNELFIVYTGKKPKVEDMTELDAFTLREPQYSDDGLMLFQKYIVELPESIAGTTACIGTQLATPIPSNYYSYVQLGSICIDESSTGSVAEIISDEDNVKVLIDASEIMIVGDFEHAAVYGINGTKVMDVTGNAISRDALPRGIYILKVDSKCIKIAL